PDTRENQAAYPQVYNQKPGLGFPIARIGALISLACGAVVNLGFCQYAGKGQGEVSLLRRLWDVLRPGDVLHDPSGPQFGAAVYYPTLKLKPYPHGGVDELPDRMSVAKNSLSVAAMFTCLAHNGNPGWRRAAELLANGLIRNYAPGEG